MLFLRWLPLSNALFCHRGGEFKAALTFLEGVGFRVKGKIDC